MSKPTKPKNLEVSKKNLYNNIKQQWQWQWQWNSNRENALKCNTIVTVARHNQLITINLRGKYKIPYGKKSAESAELSRGQSVSQPNTQ